MKPIPLKDIKRVVVIRSDHVGDLICSIPFIKSLRRGLPGAKITALLPDYCKEVLLDSPFVDEVRPYTEETKKQVLANIRQDKPDMAVCLAPRSEAYRLTYATAAPIRVGYFYGSRPLAQLACRLFYLTHIKNINVDKQFALGTTVLHEIQQLGDLAIEMGLIFNDNTVELPVDSQSFAFGEKLVKDWESPKIALHLHSRWLNLNWTFEDLMHMVRSLLNLGSLVITSGPMELDLSEKLRKALISENLLDENPNLSIWEGFNSPEKGQSIYTGSAEINGGNRCIAITNCLNFKKWAGVLKACDCLVSLNTGAIHVSAAYKKPVVTVEEPSRLELESQEWYPWQTDYRIVEKLDPEDTTENIVTKLKEMLYPPTFV